MPLKLASLDTSTLIKLSLQESKTLETGQLAWRSAILSATPVDDPLDLIATDLQQHERQPKPSNTNLVLDAHWWAIDSLIEAAALVPLLEASRFLVGTSRRGSRLSVSSNASPELHTHKDGTTVSSPMVQLIKTSVA